MRNMTRSSSKEIRKVFDSTPRTEEIFVIFEESKIPKSQRDLFLYPVKCLWSPTISWYYISKWDNTSKTFVNIDAVKKIVTKETNPEYFL